jgi:SAM-dependent methyltransferase
MDYYGAPDRYEKSYTILTVLFILYRMTNLMKKMLNNMYTHAMELNKENILNFITGNSNANILDLGCDNGEWTCSLGEKAGSKHLFGIEIVETAADLARSRGLSVTLGDLSDIFPYDSNSMDIIHANQVIEHVPNIDHFIFEIKRVLKPGGEVIISTENGSSWCNVVAAIMGWQIFSLTNVSVVSGGIGNPLALHKSSGAQSSWTHKTIFNYCGLRDVFKVHGFENIALKGSGNFPLPAGLGCIDVRHAHFLALRATKPLNC